MATIGTQIAIVENGKILLTKRSDIPLWCLPGGGIEEGESSAQAAIREAKEETGLDIQILYLLGVYTRSGAFSDHGIVFCAKVVGGSLVTASNETVDAQYFGLEELPEDILWWERQRIADALKGSRGNVWRQKTAPIHGASNLDELLAVYRSGKITAEQILTAFTNAPNESASVNELIAD